MTVITITTVGFAEQFPLSQVGEALTVVLLVAGLGIFFFLASEIGRSVMEGELRHYLGRIRRSRMIERMSGHEIVCEYGRMGRTVVEALRHAGRQVVVVDSQVSRMQELAESGVPAVAGDATLEATLLSANVQHARGLVSCLSDDTHNVYTVLTARTLNPGLFIVARATTEGAERRILQAGANRVVDPYHLGGARLAHLQEEPCAALLTTGLGATRDIHQALLEVVALLDGGGQAPGLLGIGLQALGGRREGAQGTQIAGLHSLPDGVQQGGARCKQREHRLVVFPAHRRDPETSQSSQHRALGVTELVESTPVAAGGLVEQRHRHRLRVARHGVAPGDLVELLEVAHHGGPVAWIDGRCGGRRRLRCRRGRRSCRGRGR